MKTKLLKNKLILGLLICIGTGLLFGTIEIIDGTQISTVDCDSYPSWEYSPQGECPKLKIKCPIDSSYHPIYFYCPDDNMEINQ